MFEKVEEKEGGACLILGAGAWPLIGGGGGLLERGWLFEEYGITYN